MCTKSESEAAVAVRWRHKEQAPSTSCPNPQSSVCCLCIRGRQRGRKRTDHRQVSRRHLQNKGFQTQLRVLQQSWVWPNAQSASDFELVQLVQKTSGGGKNKEKFLLREFLPDVRWVWVESVIQKVSGGHYSLLFTFWDEHQFRVMSCSQKKKSCLSPVQIKLNLCCCYKVVMQPEEQTGRVSKELEAWWSCRAFKNVHNESARTNVSSGYFQEHHFNDNLWFQRAEFSFGVRFVLSRPLLDFYRFDF